MPYIAKKDRVRAENFPDTSGELNFAVTRLLTGYLWRRGLNYANINDIVGALEGAKSEFIRRVVNPYEDKKIEENGDIEVYRLLDSSRAGYTEVKNVQHPKQDNRSVWLGGKPKPSEQSISELQQRTRPPSKRERGPVR